MVGARSAAMALNRLIDAGIDARNPRTAERELPAGRLGAAGGRGLHRRLRRPARGRRLQPLRAVPLPLADPAGGVRPLSVHQALHVVLPLLPRSHPRASRRRRPGSRSPARCRSRPGCCSSPSVSGSAASTCSTPSSTSSSTASRGCTRCRSPIGERGSVVVAALSHVLTIALLAAVGGAGRPGLDLLGRPRRLRRAARLAARGHRPARPARGRHELHDGERRRRAPVRRRRRPRDRHRVGTAQCWLRAERGRARDSRSRADTRDGTIVRARPQSGDSPAGGRVSVGS